MRRERRESYTKILNSSINCRIDMLPTSICLSVRTLRSPRLYELELPKFVTRLVYIAGTSSWLYNLARHSAYCVNPGKSMKFPYGSHFCKYLYIYVQMCRTRCEREQPARAYGDLFSLQASAAHSNANVNSNFQFQLQFRLQFRLPI